MIEDDRDLFCTAVHEIDVSRELCDGEERRRGFARTSQQHICQAGSDISGSQHAPGEWQAMPEGAEERQFVKAYSCDHLHDIKTR